MYMNELCSCSNCVDFDYCTVIKGDSISFCSWYIPKYQRNASIETVGELIQRNIQLQRSKRNAS